MAEAAAQATTRAADAAHLASGEAAQAATATSEAAHTVALVTAGDQDDRRTRERDAMAAEEGAKAAHKSASDQAYERLRGNSKQESAGTLRER